MNLRFNFYIFLKNLFGEIMVKFEEMLQELVKIFKYFGKTTNVWRFFAKFLKCFRNLKFREIFKKIAEKLQRN